jgi:hypothetical protein
MRITHLSTLFSLGATVAVILTSSTAGPSGEPQPLKASAQVVSQKLCSENDDTYALIQKQRVTFLNQSQKNVIVDKSIGRAAYGMVVARDVQSLSDGKYEWNPNLDWAIDPWPIELTAKSPLPPFAILAPAESFQVETDFWVEVRMSDSKGHGISSGNHVSQLQISSWYYTTKPEEVQRKWESYGELVYKVIKTEPLALSLPPNPKLDNCKH